MASFDPMRHARNLRPPSCDIPLPEDATSTQTIYLPAGAETAEGTCRPQENRLTLIYTLGLFAVNFGPVPVGPILDIWGPRLVSVLGCGVSVLGLVLFGVSHSGGFDAFCAASLLMSAHSRGCLAEQLHLPFSSGECVMCKSSSSRMLHCNCKGSRVTLICCIA